MKNILLLSFLITTNLFSQNVNIPDANFKFYLVGNNLININLDGEIQVSEATAFPGAINVSSGVSDLTGLAAFTSLTRLQCLSTSLINLDLSGNLALTELFINSNSLVSLNISNNTALEKLDLLFTQLVNLDVSSNIALTYLRFKSNYSLTNINVSQNTGLIDLNCTNNSLTSLDVSNNTALTNLDCSANSLTSLDLSNNKALKSVKCINNSLTSLDLRNGNNIFMSANFDATGNFLFCISVDNKAWADATWASKKDPGTVFSEDCYVGIKENQLDNITEVTIYDLYGRKVNRVNRFQVYLVRTKSNGRYTSKKIVQIN